MGITLYGYWSTNPMKVRWALEELGTEYEWREVDLFKGAHRTEAFCRITDRRTVPALTDGEVVVKESNAALVYLGERGPPTPLWPEDPHGRRLALEWLFFEASSIADPAGAVWWDGWVCEKHGFSKDEDRLARGRKRLTKALVHVERALADQPYILGDFTLVDCSIGAWIAGAQSARQDLSGSPRVAEWIQRCRDRLGFQRAGFLY